MRGISRNHLQEKTIERRVPIMIKISGNIWRINSSELSEITHIVEGFCQDRRMAIQRGSLYLARQSSDMDTGKSFVFIYKSEGEILGLLSFAIATDNYSPTEMSIEQIWWVHPDYRTGIVSGRLFKAHEEFVKDQGITKSIMAHTAHDRGIYGESLPQARDTDS